MVVFPLVKLMLGRPPKESDLFGEFAASVYTSDLFPPPVVTRDDMVP